MPPNDSGSTYRLLGLGMELAAAVLGLALFGWWVGGKLGSATAGLLVGATIGFAGGLYNLIKSALSVSSATPTKGSSGDDAEKEAGSRGEEMAASRVLHGSTRVPPARGSSGRKTSAGPSPDEER